MFVPGLQIRIRIYLKYFNRLVPEPQHIEKQDPDLFESKFYEL
jgi:hypothetical protein